MNEGYNLNYLKAIKMVFKNYFILIVLLTVTILLIQFAILSNLKQFSHLVTNTVNSSNMENFFCVRKNFSSNHIAYEYMRGSRGVVECDILNYTNFIFINEKTVYDTANNHIDYQFIKILEYQGLLNTSSGIPMGQVYYYLQLNINELVTQSKISKTNMSCDVKKIEKIMNIKEDFTLTYKPLGRFTEKNNYTLYFSNHGYYYVYCYKSVNVSLKIYANF